MINAVFWRFCTPPQEKKKNTLQYIAQYIGVCWVIFLNDLCHHLK